MGQPVRENRCPEGSCVTATLVKQRQWLCSSTEGRDMVREIVELRCG